MIVSKWNRGLCDKFASKGASQKRMMNTGASFLVAPHNLSFNKRAIQASEENHNNVLSSINHILAKHNASEAKQLKCMTEEMAK